MEKTRILPRLVTFLMANKLGHIWYTKMSRCPIFVSKYNYKTATMVSFYFLIPEVCIEENNGKQDDVLLTSFIVIYDSIFVLLSSSQYNSNIIGLHFF